MDIQISSLLVFFKSNSGAKNFQFVRCFQKKLFKWYTIYFSKPTVFVFIGYKLRFQTQNPTRDDYQMSHVISMINTDIKKLEIEGRSMDCLYVIWKIHKSTLHYIALYDHATVMSTLELLVSYVLDSFTMV